MYGYMVRQYKGNVTAMARNLKASLRQYHSSHKNPQHDEPSKGHKFWCSF